MTKTVFPTFQTQLSSISHQEASAKHWDLANTEIFQSKDVAKDVAWERFRDLFNL
jgi:hypothetical protein